MSQIGPHSLVLSALLLVITTACADDERAALYVRLDPPGQVSASGPGADLGLRVTGNAQYPLRVEVEPSTCPEGATCTDNTKEFAAPADKHVFEEAVACDLPATDRYTYKVSVFDDVGLTTQPAYFSFMCIE